MPAIPLVAAGVGGLFGLIGSHSAAKAAEKQAATISPLVQSQAASADFARQQAAIDLPKARETLGSSLDFWNGILKGDRNQAMSMVGPSADQRAQQAAASARALNENAARGGRRTLMLGEQPIAAVTDLNRNLLSLRAQAPDKQTQIGQILASMGTSESGAGTAAGGSAIGGALGAANLANEGAATSAAGMRTAGQSIGNILLELQKWKYPNSIQASQHPVPTTGTVPIFG